jgi:hypothetical protein
MDFSNMNNNQLAAKLSELENKSRSEEQNILNLRQEIERKLPSLQLGGMEDINKIIWPYIANSGRVDIAPGRTESGFITITQEAGFVMTRMTRVIYKVVEDLDQPNDVRFDYVNPRSQTNAGIVGNLNLQINDSQSSRKYMQSPIKIDQIGDATDPYKFSSPQYIAPNSQLEVRFSNSEATQSYIAFIAIHGYKIRIAEAQKMLSLQHL